MLLFCNNYLASQQFMYDNVLDIYYLVIYKNGSTSMDELVEAQPERYSFCSTEEVDADEVTVFIREPIGRYVSGLMTQIYQNTIPESVVKNMFDRQHITFLDIHTVPQFWFLMAVDRLKKIKFNIKPLSELHKINGIGWGNKNNKPLLEIPESVLSKLNHFYTEDIVLYNQFLNTTTTVENIVEKILLEKPFIDDINSYKDCLTQYFKG